MDKFYAYIAKSRWLHRTIAALLGVLLIFFGVNSFLQGDAGHFNYWGGLVTPETSILIGVLTIVFSLLPKSIIERKQRKPRSRKERLAARKAEKKSQRW